MSIFEVEKKGGLNSTPREREKTQTTVMTLTLVMVLNYLVHAIKIDSVKRDKPDDRSSAAPPIYPPRPAPR